ncbi:MAG TPA: HIT domain-containing protein [Vicinamibacteria bacterium]|nr:HIT domain-containing protein [Vicinamibacteria bacterium]
MDVLRSPWRMAYVTSGVNEPGCVLCRALAGASGEKSLVVHLGESCFVVMNLYPYNAGHLMVSPRRHVARLAEATPGELQELMALTQRLEAVFAEAYRPDGLNVGLNLGRAAGAGVEGHLHLHVVPRWSGDTNFITVTGGTRVIPEDPYEACQRLRPFFAK